MSGTILQQVAESPALTASAVPTMIMDRALRIRAVNAAYEEASLQTGDALIGQEVLVAFPDNPQSPVGRTQLECSLEHVLSRSERHHLGFLRYDIASPDNPDVYLPRVWSAVNSPILDGGRVVGVLQQVEDVTAIALARATESVEGDPLVSLAVALASATAEVAALRQDNITLQRGLASNRLIGMAIGILIRQHHITREQAFDVLRVCSQHSNRSLRDIAEELVDTGSLPTTPY